MSAPLPRPVHLRPSLIAVVAAGGAIGTAGREALTLVIPSVGGVPVAILLINLAGSFVLGLLLEALTRRGPDIGRLRVLRLGLGTGFCGGFTTYSTLALGTAELLRAEATGLAVAYAVGSVLLGAVAAWGGVLVGSRR